MVNFNFCDSSLHHEPLGDPAPFPALALSVLCVIFSFRTAFNSPTATQEAIYCLTQRTSVLRALIELDSIYSTVIQCSELSISKKV